MRCSRMSPPASPPTISPWSIRRLSTSRAIRPAATRSAAARLASSLGRGLWPPLLAVGAVVAIAELAAFLAVREMRPDAAQTAAYATVALAELLFVFSCRAELHPAWGLPRNRHLEAAVLGSLAFLLATIYVPALHDPFGTVSLASGELGIVLALALLPVLASESLKAVVRRRVG